VIDNDPNIYIGDALGMIIEPKKIAKPVNANLKLWAYNYISQMQNTTKPPPCLWAEHCIRGEKGWEVYEPLGLVLTEQYEDKVFYHEKGTNDLVEMYSIFSSEVKYDQVFDAVGHSIETLVAVKNHPQIKREQVPENKQLNVKNTIPNTNTDFNQKLADQLYGVNKNNHIYICGEAKSHCVKTSIEDLLHNIIKVQKIELTPGAGLQIYAITNMMSGIPGFEEKTETAFATMKEQGVQMVFYDNNGKELIPVPAEPPILSVDEPPTQ
jgi:nicotinamidase-related amidase